VTRALLRRTFTSRASALTFFPASTRAFGARFGTTPEQIRSAGTVEQLALVEAIRVGTERDNVLASPRIQAREQMLVFGLMHISLESLQHSRTSAPSHRCKSDWGTRQVVSLFRPLVASARVRQLDRFFAAALTSNINGVRVVFWSKPDASQLINVVECTPESETGKMGTGSL
jgi:hypothetical protein